MTHLQPRPTGKNLNTLSIVVSVFNEDEALPPFWNVLKQVVRKLDVAAEIIFVDDGSEDNSAVVLAGIYEQDKADFDIKLIHLSRNFGHEAAMIAGIDAATGDAIVCLDADLQHPPEMIPLMIRACRRGFDIVMMQRTERRDGGWLKRILSRGFYRIINRLSYLQFQENSSDFFLVSRRIGRILKNDFRERSRFIRGIIQMVGFPVTTLDFVAPGRVKGKSKYSFSQLLGLTISAVIVYSRLPLYIGLILGALFGLFSVAVGLFSLAAYIFFDTPPPGYTTLIVFISLGFSILFFLIGIIGAYIGFNFEENRRWPIYITRDRRGFDE